MHGCCNISTVLAADTTTTETELYYSGSSVVSYNSDIITAQSFSTKGTLSGSFDVTTLSGTTSISNAAKLNNGNFEVDFTFNGTGTITAYYCLRSTKSGSVGVQLTDSNGDVVASSSASNAMSSSDSTLTSVTFSDIESGSYVLKRDSSSSQEGCCLYIYASDEVSDDAVKYTVSGYTSGLPEGTIITVSGINNESAPTATAEIGSDGSWSISQTVTDETVPFAAGQTLTISTDNYNDATVTLSAASTANAFTATTVTFTEKSLTALDNDTYDSYSMPYFKYYNSNGDLDVLSSTKLVGSLVFTLDAPKAVTFASKSGSTDSSKTATLTLNDASGNEIYTTGAMNTDTGTVKDTLYLNAGTYTIVAAQSGGTQLQIASIGVKPIAVFGITDAQQKASESYYIATAEGEAAKAADVTVYEGVAFDSGDVAASSLVSGASYVVAYVIDLSTGNSINDLGIYFE